MSTKATDFGRSTVGRVVAVATTWLLGSGCITPEAPASTPPRVELPRDVSTSAPGPDAEQLRRKVAELEQRVDALEKYVLPPPRSAEQIEYDEVGPETFYQRRFDLETRDAAWADTVERAVARTVKADPDVVFRSLECRNNSCRLEVACIGEGNCTPKLPDGFVPSNPKFAAHFCRPHTDASGTVIKVVFLFRPGRPRGPAGMGDPNPVP